MIHKRLQRNIISEDNLGCHTTITSCGVCGGRIHLRQEETRLRAARITDDETWQRKTVSN